MDLLLLSLGALFAGVGLFSGVRTRPSLVAGLDGFLLVVIGGLVALHLVPHSVQLGGWPAVVATAAGLLLPMLLERGLHAGEHAHENGNGRGQGHAHTHAQGGRLIGSLALLGLVAHALLDGVALSLPYGGPGRHSEESLLGVAVVLHRLPIGLAIAWTLVPRGGVGRALQVAGLMAGASVVGFLLGERGMAVLPVEGLAIFQALIAGTLLHVVFLHGPSELSRQVAEAPKMGAVGGLLGIAVLAAVSFGHPLDAPGAAEGRGAGGTFLTLALESAPALLVGFLGAGMLRAFLRPASLGWLGRGTRPSQALRGMAFGLPLPICSCGVVPIYQGLIRSGAPTTAAMAFLIATPEIGLDAIMLSIPLLGPELAGLRVGAAAIAAIAVSLVAGAVPGRCPRGIPDPRTVAAAVVPVRARLLAGLRFGFGEVVDSIMPWILLGLAMAALLGPVVQGSWLAELPRGADVLLLSLVGMPAYVCASGATPFVAMLLAKGVSPGAAVAFLLTGPATNITTFGVLSDLHGRRTAFVFGGAMIVAAVSLGLGVNLLLPTATGAADLSSPEPASALQVASLAILGVITLLSFLRRGPRGFLAEVVPSWGPAPRGDDDRCTGEAEGDCCSKG